MSRWCAHGSAPFAILFSVRDVGRDCSRCSLAASGATRILAGRYLAAQRKSLPSVLLVENQRGHVGTSWRRSARRCWASRSSVRTARSSSYTADRLARPDLTPEIHGLCVPRRSLSICCSSSPALAVWYTRSSGQDSWGSSSEIPITPSRRRSRYSCLDSASGASSSTSRAQKSLVFADAESNPLRLRAGRAGLMATPHRW